MAKTYLTPPKAIRLANGARMQHGQIIGGDMTQKPQQRPLNQAYNIARDGAAKITPEAPIKAGMKRRTTGEELSAFHHGITVRDEPNTVKSFTRETPHHDATPRTGDRDFHDPKLGAAVLNEAASLGRRKA